MSRVRIVLLMALVVTAWVGRSDPAVGGGRIGDRLADVLRDIPADRIDSGILYDRVLPLSVIDEQSDAARSKPITKTDWLQIYSEMYRACLTTPSWPEPSTVTRQAAQEVPTGVVPIAVMNFLYNRFRPDAFQIGALEVREGRVVLGASEPFVLGRAFFATPLLDHTYAGGKVIVRARSGQLFHQ